MLQRVLVIVIKTALARDPLSLPDSEAVQPSRERGQDSTTEFSAFEREKLRDLSLSVKWRRAEEQLTGKTLASRQENLSLIPGTPVEAVGVAASKHWGRETSGDCCPASLA